MNKVIKDYLTAYKKAPVSQKFDLVKDYNNVGFVNGLKSEGVTPKEIDGFFKFLCKEQIKLQEPLPNMGYLDLVRFAKANYLFTATEKKKI